MQLKETITGTEPISTDDVKTYLKVDFNNEDTLIGTLITGVRQSIEKFTGLALIAKTIVYFDEDIEDEIRLPYPEHDEITEVKINGAVTDAYTKTGLTQFIIKPNEAFISDSDDSGIKITYTTTGNCEQAIKNEMLKLIDEKYRNRGNTFEGSISDLSENCYANLAKFCI